MTERAREIDRQAEKEKTQVEQARQQGTARGDAGAMPAMSKTHHANVTTREAETRR